MTKFLIADDHPLFRDALSAALTPLFDDLELIQSGTLDETIAQLDNHKDLDLVLLDLHMPGSEDFYGVIRISEDFPNVPVAVVSANDTPTVVSKVMAFGARGFIPKTTPSSETANAIKTIIAGETQARDAHSRRPGPRDAVDARPGGARGRRAGAPWRLPSHSPCRRACTPFRDDCAVR